ncbi:hypothetical protein ACFQJ7_06295 [Halovenus rubra]|uniref:Uncharacterized protein n=2 Tax=Halovenus rubra TaxID=869890 RepID=A0ACC7DYL1_9EURY|nr:hypothetical protein [Halovenus rubra]
MYEEAFDLLLPFALTGLYTVMATLFAGLGFLFEYKSYLFLSGGKLFIGLWAAVVGLIALNASLRVTKDRLTQRLGLAHS